MLTTLYLAAAQIQGGGDSTVPVAEGPFPGYTQRQIVGSLIFDAIVILSALSWITFIAVRTYGSPLGWFRRRPPSPLDAP